MEKKESIADVLSSGTKTFTEAKRWMPAQTVVTNGTFQATYVDESVIAKRQKSIDRQIANTQNYGDPRGKAAVWKENNTAKELAGMRNHPSDCRAHWAMYLEAIKAPRHLQKHVFENLKIWMKEHDINSLNHNFTFDTVAIMPPAWKKGYESVDLFGWKTEFQLDDLMPAAGCEIGAKVIVPTYGREKSEGKIVGYQYKGEHCDRYGKRYGRIILLYDVQYGASRYDKDCYKLSALSFPMAAAV